MGKGSEGSGNTGETRVLPRHHTLCLVRGHEATGVNGPISLAVARLPKSGGIRPYGQPIVGGVITYRWLAERPPPEDRCGGRARLSILLTTQRSEFTCGVRASTRMAIVLNALAAGLERVGTAVFLMATPAAVSSSPTVGSR